MSPNKMIGFIVKLSVKEGESARFEEAFSSLAESVRSIEQGNLLYQLFRVPTSPQEYILIEIYKDEAAFTIHTASSHMVAARSVTGPLIVGSPTVERLDVVPLGLFTTEVDQQDPI